MKNVEIRLFDLLETKQFEELNAEEIAFVLAHLSENEYRSQQRIVSESEQLEYIIPVPLPLAEPKRKVVFFRRNIPLYQALLAAGCIAFLVYIFRPEEKQKSVQFAQQSENPRREANSVIEIHDTVIKLVEVVKFHERLIRDTITIVQSFYNPQRETRMLEAGNAVQLPPINSGLNSKSSPSLSDDRSASLLPKIVNSGAFDVGR